MTFKTNLSRFFLNSMSDAEFASNSINKDYDDSFYYDGCLFLLYLCCFRTFSGKACVTYTVATENNETYKFETIFKFRIIAYT